MENCCNKIFYDFWIQTVVLLVYGMPGVKKCAESSGWQWFICFIRFDLGALLCDLIIFSDLHNWHLKCNKNVLFSFLMAINSWKKSEKWSNFCLNLASCSSSAISHCKKCFINALQFTNGILFLKIFSYNPKVLF